MNDANPILKYKPSRYHILILLVCLAALMISYGGIDYTSDRYLSTDLTHYRAMAGYSPNLPQNIQQPFIFRILGPYIAGLLPLLDYLAFRLLEFISTIILVTFFYHYLYQLKIKPVVSLVVTIIFMCNKYFVGAMLYNYFQVNDTLALLFILIMFWAMKEDRWITFGITLFLGAMTRETTLLMIPVVFVYLLERKKISGNLNKIIIAITPAILIFIILRLILQPVHGDNPFQAFIKYSGKLTSLKTWYYLLVKSFIPMTLIPLIFIKAAITYFRENLHALIFIILVFISSLFGVNNQRLMAPAFIVFYPLLASILQREIWKHNITPKFVTIILITAAVLCSVHVETCLYPSSDYLIINLLSIGSLMLVTVTMLYLRLREATKQATDAIQ